MIRVDRAKKLKTGVSFYRNSFRMHPPYLILCDGNFLFAAVDLKIANLETQFQDAFKGKVYLKAPDCVTAELATMKGRGFREAEKFAKEKCQRFRCSHEPGSPAKCIISALREGFIGGVATQIGRCSALSSSILLRVGSIPPCKQQIFVFILAAIGINAKLLPALFIRFWSW